jgi:hypothetical protein
MSMTMTRMIATLCVLCAAGLGTGCGGGDSGSPNTEKPTSDAAAPDTGAEAATGPWECVENNVAVWKENGTRVPCSTYRCHVDDGCGDIQSKVCKSDDRCISSTAETGDPPDKARDVRCIDGVCSVVPNPHQ